MLLIKVVSGENDGDSASSHAPRPAWMRVIALEIIRGYADSSFRLAAPYVFQKSLQ